MASCCFFIRIFCWRFCTFFKHNGPLWICCRSPELLFVLGPIKYSCWILYWSQGDIDRQLIRTGLQSQTGIKDPEVFGGLYGTLVFLQISFRLPGERSWLWLIEETEIVWNSFRGASGFILVSSFHSVVMCAVLPSPFIIYPPLR